MPSFLGNAAILTVVLIAALYQLVFKGIIFHTLGYGRSVTPITAFSNARCEKIDNLGLEGCEDMWLHENTGFLYMACSDSLSRTQWLPAVDHMNASARSLTDRMAVLDTRASGPVSSRLQWITPENFAGINGDGNLNLHGFDVRGDENTDTLRIILINHRPPIDPITGEPLDAKIFGANSTVEQFQTKVGSDTMRHVRTYADPLISTPNRVVWVNDHAFVFTNDHSGKVGFRRHLDAYLGGGSVGYCSRSRCNIAYSKGFNMPNGLARGRDGLIYVPSTVSRPAKIDVFTLTENHLLHPIDTILMPYPIDNLSVDKHGDIYAAGVPMVYKWNEGSKDPHNVKVPGAALKVSREGRGHERTGRNKDLKRSEGEYSVEKVLEDDGTVFPGTTIAVHDAETGRFFLGGAMSPFITICETR